MARTSLLAAARALTGDESLDSTATFALDRRPRLVVGAVLVVALVAGLVIGEGPLRLVAGSGLLVMLLAGRELVVAVGPTSAYGFVRWTLDFRLGPSYYGILPRHVAPAGRSAWRVGQYRVRPSDDARALLERLRALDPTATVEGETDAPADHLRRNGNSSCDPGS